MPTRHARNALSWLLALVVISHSAAVAYSPEPAEKNVEFVGQISAMITTEKEIERHGSLLFEQVIGANSRGLVSGSPAYTAALLQYLEHPAYSRQSLEHRLIDEFAQLYMSKEKAKTRQLPPSTKQSPARQVPQPIQPFAMQSYDRAAAVQFAYRWTSDGAITVHPDYVRQSLDCTNFVSQVLRAGGVSMVDYWYLPGRSTAEWWYAFKGTGKTDDDWAWAWVNADYLYDHLQAPPLRQNCSLCLRIATRRYRAIRLDRRWQNRSFFRCHQENRRRANLCDVSHQQRGDRFCRSIAFPFLREGVYRVWLENHILDGA